MECIIYFTGGHYTAYCLNSTNETWYEYDDCYVTEVDVAQVVNCEAYVLFYRSVCTIVLLFQNDGTSCLARQYFKTCTFVDFEGKARHGKSLECPQHQERTPVLPVVTLKALLL
jgi:hypothetical protein